MGNSIKAYKWYKLFSWMLWNFVKHLLCVAFYKSAGKNDNRWLTLLSAKFYLHIFHIILYIHYILYCSLCYVLLLLLLFYLSLSLRLVFFNWIFDIFNISTLYLTQIIITLSLITLSHWHVRKCKYLFN
jgi:hypothetical protein